VADERAADGIVAPGSEAMSESREALIGIGQEATVFIALGRKCTLEATAPSGLLIEPILEVAISLPALFLAPEAAVPSTIGCAGARCATAAAGRATLFDLRGGKRLTLDRCRNTSGSCRWHQRTVLPITSAYSIAWWWSRRERKRARHAAIIRAPEGNY
jgi:hypothetical protein